MPEVRATIVVEAKDEASAVLGKIGAASEGAGKKTEMSWQKAVKELTGFDAASLTLTGTILGVVGAVGAATKITMDWADTIDRVSRSTGESAEATSLMVTAFGSAGVSIGTLEASFKTLTKNGLQPNMATFKDLARQYQAIEDPVERNEFAMKKLGKSAAEMTEILSKTPEELDALALAASNSGKIIDAELIAKSEELTIKTQQLKDMAEGAAITFGGAMVDGLHAWATMLDALTKADQLNTIANMENAGSITAQQAELRRAAVYAGVAGAAYKMVTPPLDGMTDAHERSADVMAQTKQKEANLVAQTNALASTWQNYSNVISDGAGAANAAAEAIVRQREEMREANNAAQALAAGLDGVLAQAYEDYNAVLSETQPTMEDLRAENARLMEEQGNLVTVTTEATTSQAEYDLALQKAAKAQEELNANTDPEKAAQLAVNFEKATEKVNALAGGFGSTTTSAIDNSAAIEENKKKMAELYTAQQLAEEQLRETTAQFVFQQVSAGLDASTQLELARSLGIMDEASYEAAKAALELRGEFDDGKISVDEFASGAKELADNLADIKSKEINIHTNYTSSGNPGGGGGGVGGGAIFAQAHGGNVYEGEPVIVGDGGRPELFVPQSDGYVYPVVPGETNTTTTGDLNFYISGGGDPSAIAAEVKRQLDSVGRSADRRMRV